MGKIAEAGLAVVVGATGAQGGAVARALRHAGRPVRALVRDPRSPPAQALARMGIALSPGDLEDQRSLETALAGGASVFSVQPAPRPDDPDAERRQGRALVEAAARAGIRHFVHASVSNAGDFRAMAGWAEGRWSRNYWESKADVEAMVAAAGFPVHVLMRPAFMMENFALPKSAYMFPDLGEGRMLTAIEPATELALVAADDIGAAVAAVLAEPERFDGTRWELAGDRLTMPQIARHLSDAKRTTIIAETRPTEALRALGQAPGWVETQSWLNVVGYPARPDALERLGVAPTRFARWARDRAESIAVAG